MMNVLIIAPGNPGKAYELQLGFTNDSDLKPKNFIVKTDAPFITDEVVALSNKNLVEKILAFGVPFGTLQCLVKKLSVGPKPPKVFSLDPKNENRPVTVKKGILYLINCPKMLLN